MPKTPYKPSWSTKRQRMYLHIVESLIDKGRPLAEAQEVAARTVNRFRAKAARKHRGPKLVGSGGSRRQWYPGKRRGKRERFACLSHRRQIKSRAGLLSHYRSHKHRRKSRAA